MNCYVRRYTSAGSVDDTTLKFKVTKLREGNEYNFKVVAENKIGESEPASLPEAIMAKLPFGKITYCCGTCFRAMTSIFSRN